MSSPLFCISSAKSPVPSAGAQEQNANVPGHDALESHYQQLRGYFSRRVASQQDAADLTQETFLRVLASKSVQPVKEPLRLLFRVARNLLIDRSRRAKSRPAPELLREDLHASSAASPARTTQAADTLEQVQRAIAALPPRCRDVFILNRFEGLSYADIARRMNISPKTVEKHMAKAILSCRAALKQE